MTGKSCAFDCDSTLFRHFEGEDSAYFRVADNTSAMGVRLRLVEETVKEREAFQIMFRFLEERYSRLPSDALGGLLGEMQLGDDGLPFDQAIVEEWNKAVGQVQEE